MKKNVIAVINSMNNLAGRFDVISHSNNRVNGERVALVKTEALKELSECLTNWADVLANELLEQDAGR